MQKSISGNRIAHYDKKLHSIEVMEVGKPCKYIN